MLRLFHFLLGLLLLPLCVAVTQLFIDVIRLLPGPDAISPLFWWFLGGFAFWVVLFIALPRPTLTYVLAHELTHALWGLMMGARVSKLRVGSRGGSVVVSRNNVWITLAPYFFPFYTFLALILFALLRLKWTMDVYFPFWAALIGLTWSYHLTFTAMALNVQQPDIKIHGRVFSYALIYLINLLCGAAALAFLTATSFTDLGHLLLDRSMNAYLVAGQWLIDLWDQAWSLWPG
ncbi:MAG TPA: hypothetical protein PKE55_14315 [Kiritimatiellia bacterium]|nr:hypothetical protein [Kiritimatiellia bacterium]